MEYRDKRVVITGGTRGLGKAMALSFAREGARVAVTYSSDDTSAADMEAELLELTDECLLIKADVSVRTDVDAMIGTILHHWEYVDTSKAPTCVHVPSPGQ